MTIDTNDILNSILESLSRIDYIHPEDIPNIDLYMDQAVSYTHLDVYKRQLLTHQQLLSCFNSVYYSVLFRLFTIFNKMCIRDRCGNHKSRAEVDHDQCYAADGAGRDTVQ